MSEPIGWSEWSDSAFARARAEDRPILLSLVTAWSDACALMDETTLAAPAIVALVRAGFIPVKVDADARPDINERFNLGGWPTIAFLTPDGDVLTGATYLDVEQMMSMLARVADAWRNRAPELRTFSAGGAAGSSFRGGSPDGECVEFFRSLLFQQFDAVHGGFGTSPKLPHPRALLAANTIAMLTGDAALADMCDSTIERLDALWDSDAGGFCRHADSPDWALVVPEKTLEDNAALLHLFVDVATSRESRTCRSYAARLVEWATLRQTDDPASGFWNGRASRGPDRSVYVDGSAEMASGILRAAALFDDTSARDRGLQALEGVILPSYQPGGGVGHSAARDASRSCLFLTDQIRLAAAVVWAHVSTGQLPYSMLAAELVQFAIRTMWDEREGSFVDRHSASPEHEPRAMRAPARPFEINCEAACVLQRLSLITGNAAYHDRALTILASFAGEYPRRHELFGAPYPLAFCEVIHGAGPAGLLLERVDWQLNGL